MLSIHIGHRNYAEYLTALTAARAQIDKATGATDPAHARSAIKKAYAQLGIADTRAASGQRN